MLGADVLGFHTQQFCNNFIETVSKEEHLDRSMAIRLLLEEGYDNYAKRKAAEEYKTGRITISKAAEKAGFTLWEMEQFLISKGYKSQYSTEDLEEELLAIAKQKK